MLLLDEPMGALDAKLRKQLQIELRALQQAVGTTFVYVTHDQEEALTMSDRLAVLRDGRLMQVGTPSEVYSRRPTPTSPGSSVPPTCTRLSSPRWAEVWRGARSGTWSSPLPRAPSPCRAPP